MDARGASRAGARVAHIARLGAIFALLVVGACGSIAAPSPAVRLQISTSTGDPNAYVPSVLTAPSHTLVAVDFTNASTLEHNLVFIAPISGRTRDIVPPTETDSVQIQTPAAGDYRFVCTIHEEMTGTLFVR
jgi:plastocyanin